MAKRAKVQDDTFKFKTAPSDECIHVLGQGVRCNTEKRAVPRSGRRELVLDAPGGQVCLWDQNVTLRWKFRDDSLKTFQDPVGAAAAIEGLLSDAVLAWGPACPIKFQKSAEAYDFEIVVRRDDEPVGGGYVLAEAFMPDAGRHELLLFPMLFRQPYQEMVDTLVHEVGHMFGLRHYFALTDEADFPAELFGTHSKFSIMNYGADSKLTQADQSDLMNLYQGAWSGRLKTINGKSIKLVHPFHEVPAAFAPSAAFAFSAFAPSAKAVPEMKVAAVGSPAKGVKMTTFAVASPAKGVKDKKAFEFKEEDDEDSENEDSENEKDEKDEKDEDEEESQSHVLRGNHVCGTEQRGHATRKGRTPAELVLDASHGFIPLWDRDVTLRWKFSDGTLNAFQNPATAGQEIESALADAILAWGDAAPVKFQKSTDESDFEVVVHRSDYRIGNGYVLASAFFPDGGRQQLDLYPILFRQPYKERVETLSHEIGHAFGLRHFFALIKEKDSPAEVFGTHSKFSIMNYGEDSHLTPADRSDLKKLYQAVWSGRLTEINGTRIKLVRPYHEGPVGPFAMSPLHAFVQPVEPTAVQAPLAKKVGRGTHVATKLKKTNRGRK